MRGTWPNATFRKSQAARRNDAPRLPTARVAAARRCLGGRRVMMSAAANGSNGTSARALAIQLTIQVCGPSLERAGFYTEARLPQSQTSRRINRRSPDTRADMIGLTFN